MTIHDSSPSPFAAADTASSAIRELNHVTLDPRACTLHDVYSVLGALAEMAVRLQQATRQMADVMAVRLAAGGLSVEAGQTPTVATVVESCDADLASAGEAAGELASAFSAAHQRVASLADDPTAATSASPITGSSRPDGSPSQHLDRRAIRNRGRSI